MFTGLIEEIGIITKVDYAGATSDLAAADCGVKITISADHVLKHARLGDSIALDGACMTVVDLEKRDSEGASEGNKDSKTFSVDVSPESLSKTNFSTFKPGRRVNLERPLTMNSDFGNTYLGGHYVTGHVDGLATLVDLETSGDSHVLTFQVNQPDLAELMVPKGSVTLNGISLTVNTVNYNRFSVAIIPFTLSHTNLGDFQVGDSMNIETDLMGKYIRQLMSRQRDSETKNQPILLDILSQNAADQKLNVRKSDEQFSSPLSEESVQPVDTLHKTYPSYSASAKIHTGQWFNHD